MTGLLLSVVIKASVLFSLERDESVVKHTGEDQSLPAIYKAPLLAALSARTGAPSSLDLYWPVSSPSGKF